MEGASQKLPLKEVVVVIPAYEAGATIGSVVLAVRALGLPVIVVDDASSDATAEEAEDSGARVIRRPLNSGKGRAFREGMKVALEQGYAWVLAMDADGQHLASEIPRFLDRAARGSSDMIVGNRMKDPHGMPWVRWLTNRLMSWFISRMTGQRIPDTQCGFRLIGRRVLEGVTLVSDRFEIESELVIKAAQQGFRVSSVQVSSVYRRESSFIHPLRDAFRFIRLIRSFQRRGGAA